MQYLDFDLEIGPGQNSRYPVTVRLPAGAVQGVLQFPFAPALPLVILACLMVAHSSGVEASTNVSPSELFGAPWHETRLRGR